MSVWGLNVLQIWVRRGTRNFFDKICVILFYRLPYHLFQFWLNHEKLRIATHCFFPPYIDIRSSNIVPLHVINGFIVSYKSFLFKLTFSHFNFLIYEKHWTSSLIFWFDAGMFFYVVFLICVSPSKTLWPSSTEL